MDMDHGRGKSFNDFFWCYTSSIGLTKISSHHKKWKSTRTINTRSLV